MRENDSYFDITFIYHPSDTDHVERIAAQLRATGANADLNEGEFGRTADGLKRLKASILRSYTVAFVMSPDSAESQLCNELLQYAVGKGKRLATLILNDDIGVEVHPAIAQNPYVFFREDDELAARVEELRAYLTTDDSLKLHTELLTLAETWRDRGRPPDLLLPPARLEEAREWLATAPARHPKPSALQLEYVHSSRRQPPRREWARPWRTALIIVIALALGAVLVLFLRAVAGWQEGREAGASTLAARTQVALTVAGATAAGDSAVGLIDQVAATGAIVRAAVAQDATAEAIKATAEAQATNTAQALAAIRSRQLRATEAAELEQDEVASRLVHAGEDALERGNIELALALAWEAKDRLDNPRGAHRLLRRAASAVRALTIEDVALLEIHPAGRVFALAPNSRDQLHIYDGESWARQHQWSDHEGKLTALVYSPAGEHLISAADDGEIVIRDGSTGAVAQRLSGQAGAVTALALGPAGDKLVSAASDPLLVAWDISSGEELAAYTTGDEGDLEIRDLALSADGERVIGWYEQDGFTMMAQWSADSLELLSADSDGRVYHGTDGRGRIGYSGGSSLPAYPGDRNTGDLILWDLGSGEQRTRLTDGFNWSFLSGESLAAGTDDLRFFAFYEDIALVVVNNSETGQRANLVDVAGGGLLRRFESEIASIVTTAAFLDAETILSATSDNRVLLWSSSDGRLIREIGAAPHRIVDLQVNLSARLAIATTDAGASHLWQIKDASGEPLLKLAGALPGTTISPSGANVLLVEQASISLREVESGDNLVQLPTTLVSAAGDRFAAYADEGLHVYDMETGAAVRSWDWEAGPITDLQLAPAGDLLLIHSENDELWLARDDVDAPLLLGEDMARPALVRFAPSGDWVLTLIDELALLWHTELGLASSAYPLGAGARDDVQAAFSAEGERVIFYLQLEDGLGGLTKVNLADNSVQRETFVNVQLAALSGFGERLSLAYRDGRVHVLSTDSAAVIHQLRADVSDLRKLHYLPESATLATAAGPALILWDAEAGVVDQRLAVENPIVDFRFNRDGKRVLTADESGAFGLWQLESAPELLARIAAERRPRELTCGERERYLVAPLCE
ncbi:MAG: TIR domain-containing protein [Chloroflexi bacterium]|nr:TIR domain-containing protein [Chloroflexota bacterium]